MDPQNPSAGPVPAPRLLIRLAWRVGVYIGAQLPLLFCYGGVSNISLFFWFPEGLVSPYISQIYPITPKGECYWPWDLLYANVLWIGYVFYTIHFSLFLLLSSRRTFRIFLMILIIVVLINLGGCALTIHDGFGPPHRTH